MSLGLRPFSAEIDKQGRALCKKCRQRCLQGELRIAKPYSCGSNRLAWYHPDCIFEVFAEQPRTTKVIEGPHDINGWESLNESDKALILTKIQECKGNEGGGVPAKTHKDNLFRYFRKIVSEISNLTSANEKIKIFRELFGKGSDGGGFKSDKILWCKLLLPALGTKTALHDQLIKIFSRMFNIDVTTMSTCQGDIGMVIQHFFEASKYFSPVKHSTLTIFDVRDFLKKIQSVLGDDELLYKHFENFVKKCTGKDLKVVIRIIKHDLRMSAGPRIILQGLHPDAYKHFETSRDIKSAINACFLPAAVKVKQDASHSLNSTTKTKKLEISSLKSNKRQTSSPVRSPTGKRKRSTTDCSSSVTNVVNTLETNIESEIHSSTEIKTKESQIPRYFENVILLLEEGVSKIHSQWVGYFIAYGGSIVKSDECKEATHVLHLKDTISEPVIDCAPTAKHVIVEWIKDTVSKQSLQEFRPYSVRWQPSAMAQ